MAEDIQNIKQTDDLCNLHGHGFHSLLDGMTRPTELVNYTLEIGQPASCITDHGVMYSMIDHFQYAESKGQKAIAGFEAYVVKDHLIKNKEEAQSETENKREHMVLLAKDNEGYKRITKMCSVGCTEGFYYRPRIDDKVIEDIGTNGVIGMSACLAGRIAQRLLKDDIEGAEKWAIHYYKLFNGNFYLEIQPTIHKEQVKVNLGLIEIHKKTGIPIVATSDFHYLRREDSETHDVLLAMQSRSLVNDPNRWKFPGDTFFVMTRKEMENLFKQNGHEVLDQNIVRQAMDATVDIAKQCNVSFNWGKAYLPVVTPPSDNEKFNEWSLRRKEKLPEETESMRYMRYLCIKGLKAKGLMSQEYKDRLEFEIEVINKMGFPDYFLIMEDIMKYCKENDIPVGPARGSGGGSLVAYALGITQIDPLIYDLLFERFLNPERGKLPDIDSDFCVDKGYKVFEYIIQKYGKQNCCNVATFGRLQLKAVIKDIAKAMGVPFEEVNEFTKNISDEIAHVVDLQEDPFFVKYPEIYKHASKLEGSPRHVSQHPAGICVTPVPVTDLIPVQNAKETQEGETPGFLSQFEKEQCESAGLVKLDILKLKNVTEIRWQLKEIKRRYGIELTEQDIPLDDKKTWDTICKGDTLGVFQFASNVALPVLKKIQPRNIEDLSAANAFIRPGSSGLDEFVEGKNNSDKIRKLDPRLDRHLAKTYGAIVYQEQIMFLISELMGISFGQADLYRRALEKPNKDKKGYVKKFNETVVDIAVSRGFNREVADLVRQLIIDNSGYGFNKSHSIAYSIISYWTAWMKANYPLIFYTTMFNGNLDQLPEFMAEAKRNGITIYPPHASYSKFGSIIENEENKIIRIGFNAVKGIGPKAVESIVESQPFTSVDDFFERNQLRAVNKKVIEALINVNAFEGLGINIENDDMPDNIKSFYNIQQINGKNYVMLNRSQMVYWYIKVNEINTKKASARYLVPGCMIKNKYFEEFNLEKEKDGNVVIPEDKLDDFGINLVDIENMKTTKKPKGIFKDDNTQALSKITIYRKPFFLHGFEISQIKENALDIYLKEVEEFGYSFVPHPLEKDISKIASYDSVEDGYMLVTGGIITELIQRLTRTNKKMYWMIIQTPREKVRVTLWDNQFKQYAPIIKLHNVVKVKGTKGFGGINCEAMAEIKF